MESGDHFINLPGGQMFYCHCGCNVFRKPDMERAPNVYRCNACRSEFEGVKATHPTDSGQGESHD